MIILQTVTVGLLTNEGISLYKDFKKGIYINGEQLHSVEHITYIIALVFVLLLSIIQIQPSILYLVLSFSSLLIWRHLKSERENTSK